MKFDTIERSGATEGLLYRYAPLHRFRSIRLLQLRPATSHSDLIELKVLQVNLDDAPKYFALSYVWGDPSHSTTILCNGMAKSITQDLFAALIAIRSREYVDGDHFLWIDAICIDQSNPHERSAQVQLMGEIFKRAGLVYAWLGYEISDKDTRTAMALIDRLRHAYTLFHEPSRLEQRLNPSMIEEIMELAELPKRTSHEWKALGALFFDSPFYSRTWIIQEVTLAVKCLVLRGTIAVPWSWLTEVADAVHEVSRADFSINQKVQHSSFMEKQRIKERRRRDGADMPLRYLLDTLRGSQATDQRDKVYALLGLSPSAYAMRIIPDYTASVDHVFCDAARAIITEDRNLDVLCLVEGPSETSRLRTLDLPSWVPDFTAEYVNIGTADHRNTRRFYASGTTLSENVDIGDPRVLAVKGYLIDTIKEIGFSCALSDIDGPNFGLSEATRRQVIVDGLEKVQNWKPHAMNEDPYAVLSQTLTAGSHIDHDWPIAANQIEESRNAMLKLAYSLGIRNDKIISVASAPYSVEEPELSSYITTLDWMLIGRQLVVTTDGHMGLAHSTVKPGDAVCILLGGQTPFILRSNGKAWEFQGESYIHGLMSGEVFSMKDLHSEIFKIV